MGAARAGRCVPALFVLLGLVPLPTQAASIERVTPCPFAIDADELAPRLDCGYLEVPERHANRAGAQIRLPFVVIRSASRNPRPDPVVFLHGGPGAAPLESKATIERFAVHPFAQDRDIVLYNQRGSRQTVPALDCAALEVSRAAIHAENLTREQRDARVASAASECLRELREQGRDVAAYNAQENAQDLRALRTALGYAQWNLLAVSYGTWMAQAAARADPDGVRSLILDSVMSPQSDLFMSQGPRNFSLGLDRALAACSADPDCARAFPDLATQLKQVLASLEAKPLALKAAGATAGESIDVIVNSHDFLSVIHWMLYNARTLRLVPLLIAETSRGETAPLVKLMENVYPGFGAGAPGPSPAFFAIVCNDQYTARNPLPLAPANPAYEGFSITSFMTAVCAGDARGRAARPLPRSTPIDVPAMLLSGHFDPMTPDLYAAELVPILPRSLRIVVPASGHSTLSEFEACQTHAAQRFLDTLDPSRSHECLENLPRVQFVLDPGEARSLLR